MTDLGRLTAALAAGALVLVASACSNPSDTPTDKTADHPPSADTVAGDGHACEAIDVQVAGADNGVPLEEPSGVGVAC